MIRQAYRLVLRACPPGVRQVYGREMEELFLHGVAMTATGRAWPRRLAVYGRGFADALTFAMRTRFDRRAAESMISGHSRPSRSPFMKPHDLIGAFRFARTRPWLAGAIVLMLALGIGSTTALFSVVQGVLLAPLPFPDADRLVSVYGARPDRGWTQLSLTEANFWDLHDRNHTFEAMGGWHGGTAILGGESPEQVSAAFVSSGFLRALGVAPVVGHLFAPEDDQPGADIRPAILSHALWVRRYGADRAVVGRAIAFGSGPRTIIGVLPAGTPWLDGAEVFVPFVRAANADRGSFEYAAIGRLKPGVTFETALADLQALSRDLAAQYPATNAGLESAMDPSSLWVASPALRRTLWILLGAVGLLLAIACVNATNLLLARASARARENAVRAALGASRADLVREGLTESVILSIAATVVGLAIAAGLLRVMRAFDPGGIPRLDTVTLNGWVFAFASIVALAVGLATGLAPALQMPGAELTGTLRHGQRGTIGDRRHARLRTFLVGAEVALSVMLLVGAGLLVRSFTTVLQTDRGFQTDQRLFLTVTIPPSYGEARTMQTAQNTLARVRQLPDVLTAAAVSGRPLSNGSTGLGLGAADHPDTPGAAVPWATWRRISTDYFTTMGLELVQGRDFTADEQIGKPWRTVVSQRVATLLWPGENPIGRTITLWKGQSETPAEVVGVVSDMRERGLESDPTLAVYFPSGAASSSLQIVMHTRGRPEDIVPSIRAAIASIDPGLPISNVRTLEDIVDRSVATRRFTVLLIAVFASLALVLALAGVYGVLAYSIARQTAEIGVRLALGARHHGVLRLMVSRGMRPVLLGGIAGLLGIFWAGRLMTSLLFGVTPNDPATYLVVAGAVLSTGALACYLPSRRVLRVDPIVALRSE